MNRLVTTKKKERKRDIDGGRGKYRVREREREGEREREFVCLFGFLTSSSTTRLYRGRAPRQSV